MPTVLLRTLAFGLLPLFGSSCVQETSIAVDSDGDGWTEGTDCNDADPAIHPEAVELCDGIENNCDGVLDLAVATAPTWFADADGDGHGSLTIQLQACLAPPGFVDVGDDCDDGSTAAFPGHEELCDGRDNDCEPSTSAPGGEEDGDLDHALGCEDCDDLEPRASPFRDEVCDGIDNDCDDETDEDSAIDAGTWYGDADDDGFGNGAVSQVACEGPVGAVIFAGDCADLDDDRHPGAAEGCDGLDTDCEDGPDPSETDADGDGIATCAGDCDDADDDRNPNETESCNAVDDDCDGVVDDGAIGTGTWYADGDGDGVGGTILLTACSAPPSFVGPSGDCDDGAPTVFPGATELCDGVDTDCAGGPGPSEIDVDGDGAPSCDGDCAEGVVAVGPFAPELCNGSDDDCDTVVPPNEIDADGDGASACGGDCDDGDATRAPAATELCDLVDNDCDGSVDEDQGAQTWYIDQDGDSYGDPAWTLSLCTPPSGWVSVAGDCDDDDSLISPGALEQCNGWDDNCDSAVLGEESDLDADGVVACEDCAPADPTRYPLAPELCNGVDDDCDSVIDDGSGPLLSFYADSDGDTHGDPSAPTSACAAPPGYVASADDCDDEAASNHPGAAELCTDGADNNCDTDTDCEDGACSTAHASCWVCGDWEVDPGEECDDGPPAGGDGCDEFCQSEIDLSGLFTTIFSGGRDVYVWQSNPSLPLATWNTFCEDRGLDWYVPLTQSDAQTVINAAYNIDTHHTWIITKNHTTAGTWAGFSVTVDSPGCVGYSSSGFSAIRKWACSYCEPESYNTTTCWDSHSYDWLLCEAP